LSIISARISAGIWSKAPAPITPSTKVRTAASLSPRANASRQGVTNVRFGVIHLLSRPAGYHSRATPAVSEETFIMATTTIISEQAYRELVFADTDHLWELWDGALVEKPLMSMKHDNVSSRLSYFLQGQLDWSEYRVNVNGGKTRYTARNYYIPDVIVIPAEYQIPYQDDPAAFNAFAEPLSLVVEIWSRTTGDYDIAAKLPVYRQRGDLEIWYLHPYERTLTVWRRQPDGSYSEDLYRGGVVPVVSLPGVTIDLDALLDS
jgi:Uma2 family endonuclease